MLLAAPEQSRRVLLVTSVLPWPLHRNGGAQRTDLLRQALRASGCRVDTLALLPRPGPDVPDDTELRRHGVTAAFPIDVALATRPRPRLVPAGFTSIWSLAHVRRLWQHRYQAVNEVVQWVRDREGDYDAIYVRYLQTALVAGMDRRNPTNPPPVVVDVDDVDWLTLAGRFAAQPWPGLVGRLGMWLAHHTVKTRCTRALPSFNGLFVTNAQDLQELARRHPDVTLLPNIPYADPADPDRLAPLPLPLRESNEVLFIGDLEFGPNVTGLDWFIAQCWPAILRQAPNATLRIVGRGISQEQRQRWSAIPGIRVIGFAEDLRAEYARSACTIAPTWWGGGTKIKVAESAAMGRPCVATPHAARGYESLAEAAPPALLVAATPDDFATAVVRLLHDPELRMQMSAAGQVLVQRGFDQRTFQRIVGQSLDRVASVAGRSR